LRKISSSSVVNFADMDVNRRKIKLVKNIFFISRYPL